MITLMHLSNDVRLKAGLSDILIDPLIVVLELGARVDLKMIFIGNKGLCYPISQAFNFN